MCYSCRPFQLLNYTGTSTTVIDFTCCDMLKLLSAQVAEKQTKCMCFNICRLAKASEFTCLLSSLITTSVAPCCLQCSLLSSQFFLARDCDLEKNKQDVLYKYHPGRQRRQLASVRQNERNR